MGTDKKASLSGTFTWSDGSSFDGFYGMGLVPPLRGGIVPYTKFFKNSGQVRVELPQWSYHIIRDGKFISSSYARFNDSISPPNTQYVGYFIDYQGNILATSSLYTVTASPVVIPNGTLVIPTPGNTFPVPCQSLTDCDIAAPTLEVPSGVKDGVNKIFTLTRVPKILLLYWNGQLLTEGLGYTLSGTTITYENTYEPAAQDDILAVIFG